MSGIRDIKIPPLPQLNTIKNDALSLNSEHKGGIFFIIQTNLHLLRNNHRLNR
jgi:hypothetical protein